MRLSQSFFFRDFLHSEISGIHGIANIPHDPELAIAAGTRLCKELLEPLQAIFGRIAIRSAYRAPAVNACGNQHKLNCASNEKNRAAHIGDERDADGRMGATACIVIPWFAERYAETGDWTPLAWWIHDRLPYGNLCFLSKLAAFNLRWRESPERQIDSYAPPKGCLTKPGMANHERDHSRFYADLDR